MPQVMPAESLDAGALYPCLRRDLAIGSVGELRTTAVLDDSERAAILSVREPHLRLGTGHRGRAGCLLLAFDAKRRLWFSGSRRFFAFSTLFATELRAGIGGLAEPCGGWGSGLLCGFVDIYANRRFGEPGLAQTIAASLSCEARARRRSFRLEGRRRRRAGCALRRVDVYWGSSCL